MQPFENLTTHQKQELLKFPVYISLLGSSHRILDPEEKLVAIKFAHTKAFSCQPLLADYCRDADIAFKHNLEEIESGLPKDKKNRDAVIKKELFKLEGILRKLGDEYAFIMHQSLKTFKSHVSKAHHSVIEDFILPIPIPGLTD